MKLSISTSQDAIKDVTGSSYIRDENVYDVKILFASVKTTTNGAKTVDFNLEYKGNPQVIYGPTIINKNGQANDIGMSLINKLGVIAGLSDGQELNIESETHKVGKDQKNQEFDVITDFSSLDVKIRVQREYSRYNGQIRRALHIRNVFREDGASAAEISNGAEIGKQMQLEIEKYTAGPSFKDGVTQEEATAWEESQRAGSGKTPAPTSGVVTKRSGMFS